MSQVTQMQGMASGLFSSALFCLWLSTASLVVWVDFGTPPAQQVAAARSAAAQVSGASAPAIPHD